MCTCMVQQHFRKCAVHVYELAPPHDTKCWWCCKLSCVQSHTVNFVHMPICFCVQTDTAIIKHITAHTHDVQLCSKKQTSSFNRSKCRPSRSTTLSRVSLYTHTHTCIVTNTLICWWVRGSCSRAQRELATVNVYTCHIRSTISLPTVPLTQAIPYHL